MAVYKVQRMGKIWYQELIEAGSEEEAKEKYECNADWEQGFEWTDEYWVEEG